MAFESLKLRSGAHTKFCFWILVVRQLFFSVSYPLLPVLISGIQKRRAEAILKLLNCILEGQFYISITRL